MQIKQKLSLMFIPLAIGFAALFVVVDDLKHPHIVQESCQLVGRGAAVQKFKTSAQVLFKEGNKMENDIGLHCDKLGNVLVNQTLPLPLKPMQIVPLKTKHYRYMPNRYYLYLGVVNPKQN